MRAYIANVLPRLQKYSARLDNLALFTDHPWIQIDESGDRTVFVFRSEGNELLISKNGNVNTCNWEYLDYMDSLLLETNGKKTLYNQGFMDGAVMILSKDGQSDYLLLANENKVQERDAEKILANLSRKYLTASASGSATTQQDNSEHQRSHRKRKQVSQTEDERKKEQEIQRVILAILCLVALIFLISILSSLG